MKLYEITVTQQITYRQEFHFEDDWSKDEIERAIKDGMVDLDVEEDAEIIDRGAFTDIQIRKVR